MVEDTKAIVHHGKHLCNILHFFMQSLPAEKGLMVQKFKGLTVGKYNYRQEEKTRQRTIKLLNPSTFKLMFSQSLPDIFIVKTIIDSLLLYTFAPLKDSFIRIFSIIKTIQSNYV